MPFVFPLNDRQDCRYYCDEQREILKKFAGENNIAKIVRTGKQCSLLSQTCTALSEQFIGKGLELSIVESQA
jgi:hypothetical protein